ncbi:hypothetical protein C7293_28140 [filamentous cyanobacterium CCT1]|nr:hypothetical protein C7293_28140 [filamentous cyanobacterium CCT1]PSN80782.1 hypothetical protein C8B47_04705 [filamentous cyanobacterium CCP4]
MPDANAIFISYRRSDSNDVSGRIYDRLVAHFGLATVFKDVHSIPYGTDFPAYIQQELAKCSVLLAVIGPSWLTVEKDGQRRLDNPDDWVRIEIQTALENDAITVIPLLVGEMERLTEAQLPEPLKPLARINSAVARPDPDFHQDMTRLTRRLEEVLEGKSTLASSRASEKSFSLAQKLELDDLNQQLALLSQQHRACAEEARLTGDPDRKVVLTERVKRLLQQISAIDGRINAIQTCSKG